MDWTRIAAFTAAMLLIPGAVIALGLYLIYQYRTVLGSLILCLALPLAFAIAIVGADWVDDQPEQCAAAGGVLAGTACVRPDTLISTPGA